jgi:hypothetical protein
MDKPLTGDTSDPNINGVLGVSHSTASAVGGINDFAPGPGLGGNGAAFESAEGEGVRGTAKNSSHAGVVGKNSAGGIGVFGESLLAAGISVFGQSDEGIGVFGLAHGQFRNAVVGINDFAGAGPGKGGNGGAFESAEGEGVRGTCKNAIHAGVVGKNSAGGIAIFGESLQAGGVGIQAKGARLAGLFEGDVEVTGKINCPKSTITCFDVSVSNADCAEEFELTGTQLIEPGTLMSFGTDDSLIPSSASYDNKVAGVISGAGDYKPGIVLDRQPGGNRVPIALLGKVFCKVDAQYAPIEVGDLLTTSPTLGHAMKATDHVKAFGSVIGKALRPQAEGRGMIPILVALQ